MNTPNTTVCSGSKAFNANELSTVICRSYSTVEMQLASKI